ASSSPGTIRSSRSWRSRCGSWPNPTRTCGGSSGPRSFAGRSALSRWWRPPGHRASSTWPGSSTGGGAGGRGMGEAPNPRLRRALLEVVENQLRDGTPPETRQTLDRLMAAGHARERAVELIACVVSSEVFDVLRSGKPYDEARYLAGLRAL